MTLHEASRQIADKLEQAKKLVGECEQIADDNGLDFSFNPSDAYGMGGTYTSKKQWNSSGCEWESSGCYEEEDAGWNSSSAHC